MQDTSFIKPAEEILSCSRPSMDSRRLKPPTDILKCPRCESYNTKFCYYNNYSLSQPRHFCKNCRRYWTKGGALRNVPVGGGCRKNKRSKQRVMSSCHEEQPINSESVNPISSALPDNPSVPAAHYSAFYRLPMSEAHEINLSSLATAQATLKLSDQVAVSSSTSPAGFFGTSTQGSVPSLSQLSGLMGLDFTAAIRHEHGNSGLGDFSAPLNDVNHDLQWRLQQRKLLPLQKEVEPLRERQVLLAMSSEQNQKVERVKNLAFVPQCLKMEDGRKETDDWNCGQGGGVFEGIGEQNYWNNNGPWSDFCAYNPSAHTLL